MMRPSVVYQGKVVDSVFDDFFKDAFFRSVGNADVSSMKTDIKDCEDHYEIDMDLPGFSTEDVKAELKDGYMTISADHSEEKEEKDEEGHYIRRERYSGRYRRNFYVGYAVTQEDIKAKYTDGVLKVSVPKVEKKVEEDEKQSITIES